MGSVETRTDRKPRYYQQRSIDKFFALEWPRAKSPAIVHATGTGKTSTACWIAQRIVEEGGRVAWITHRDKLARDAAADLESFCGDVVGFVGAGLGYDYDAQVVVMKKDTARNDKHHPHVGEFELVIIDECHHSPAKTYQHLLDALTFRRKLGLTATMDRLDGAKLGEEWEVLDYYSMLDGIRDGYLLRPYAAVIKIPELDLSRVKQTRRDYVAPELERELLRSHIVEHTVAALQKPVEYHSLPFRRDLVSHDPSSGGGVLVYCVGKEQASLTAAAIEAMGWTCAVVTSDTSADEQDEKLEAFKRGDIRCLVNCSIITEGTDLPRAQTVVLARATTSWSLYMQILGRAVRPFEGQNKAYVIDLVGATKAHSIVSAAVIVDGVDCEESNDGKHHFIQLETGEGRCEDCAHTIKCFLHEGGHKFEDGKCECGAAQCPESDTYEHHFVDWEPGVRMCIHCGMNSPEPIGALIGRVNPPRLPVMWMRLNLPQRVWAAHLGKVGILYNVQHGDLFQSFWYPMKGKLKKLSLRPVSAEMSRLLTQDVARRADRVKGYYGGRRRKVHLDAAMREAIYLARTHKIWSL